MSHWLKRSVVFCASLSLIACGGGGSSDSITTPPIAGCSVTEQNQFVIDLMNDIYYWVNDIPLQPSAADFASPEETMDAMLFTTPDRFSGIRDAAENDAFFSESQFIGVGITLSFIDDSQVFIAQVFGDGPAAAAGLARGYEVLSINGTSVAATLAADESVSDLFGANEVGVNVDLQYRDLAGAVADVSFAKALVTIETVSQALVIDIDGVPTGYLHFRNFVEPSFDALTSAFVLFQQENVQDLILDVRYNGGGLISVAEFLSGLIGGTGTDNEIFAKRVHNTQNSNLNVTTVFDDQINALDLQRLVVITAGGTASASELVVNGLEPFMDITLVGEQSFGKPVGSYQFDFCDKVAVPIAFQNFNAVDEGDYFDGLPVDCGAEDGLSEPLGSEQESMLAEAITVMRTGACSPIAANVKQHHQLFSKAQHQQYASPDELRQIIMAH